MDAAWIVVIGSLGGVLIGGLLNALTEQRRQLEEARKWERERSTRLEDHRRELAAQLPSLLEEVRSRTWSYVDYRMNEPDWRHDSYVQEQADRLEEASAAFTRVYYESLILGMSGRLAATAVELFDWRAQLMSDGFRPKITADEGYYRFDPDEWLEDINAFVAAAADELGGTGRRDSSP